MHHRGFSYTVSCFGNQIHAVWDNLRKDALVVGEIGSAGGQDLSVAIIRMEIAFCLDACSFY